MKSQIAWIAAIGLAWTVEAQGQGYQFIPNPLGAIPTTLAGGGYSMDAAVGMSAGPVAGGAYSLSASSQPLYIIPGAAALLIAQSANGILLLWNETGLVLESTSDLSNPNSWQPVDLSPGQQSFTVQSDAPRRFFRLRQ